MAERITGKIDQELTTAFAFLAAFTGILLQMPLLTSCFHKFQIKR